MIVKSNFTYNFVKQVEVYDGNLKLLVQFINIYQAYSTRLIT